MKQWYTDKKFHDSTLQRIETMNGIITEYQQQGFVLTVRQLYYQLVARDIIPNTLQSYKNAAAIINDAKLAGLIDWDAIEDRTREFISRNHWENGSDILRASASSFHVDMWANQEHRAFVIVEKEALVGVLERTCKKFDVPLLAARGYPSSSVLREFCEDRVVPALNEGQQVVILHLGDHDPSGIDMSRDLEERLALFTEGSNGLHGEHNVAFERIALNMKQIKAERPPENPAKSTDSRFDSYKEKFGTSSWELDALSPTYLDKLLKRHIDPLIDDERWQDRQDYINATKAKITKVADRFETDEDDEA